MELTEEDEIELRNIFEEFDVDKSGAIDANELMKGAQVYGLNPTKDEIDNAWTSVDFDNNGTLSYEEFRALVILVRKTREQQEAELHEAIDEMMRSCGLEQGETMSKADFMEFIKTHGQEPLSNEEIDELFRDLDQDGDTNTLNRQELVDLFTRKNNPSG